MVRTVPRRHGTRKAKHGPPKLTEPQELLMWALSNEHVASRIEGRNADRAADLRARAQEYRDKAEFLEQRRKTKVPEL
jgi:hypothetical protein